jgi:predicted nucleic acid-binding protein
LICTEAKSESIALALEMRAEHVLIDERDGWLLARQLGLKPLGVLVLAGE